VSTVGTCTDARPASTTALTATVAGRATASTSSSSEPATNLNRPKSLATVAFQLTDSVSACMAACSCFYPHHARSNRGMYTDSDA
jgi:hypothetical protein